MAPTHLAAAWAILNEGRRAIGRPAFIWDDRLARSAQELTDWAWQHYLAADVEPMYLMHGDGDCNVLARLERAGWPTTGPDGWPLPGPLDAPYQRNWSECGNSSGTSQVGDDGRSYQRTADGWCYPWKTPENHAKWLAHALSGIGPGTIQDPNEPHRKDFYAGWTHAAIGWTGGMFVIEYGLPSE